MPSNAKETRKTQTARYETELSQRRESLKEQGLSEDKIRKDARVKRLLARLRQVRKAIDAIHAKAALNEKLAKHKIEKAERKATDKASKKGKGKKKAEKAQAESGKKAKKEKKKK